MSYQLKEGVSELQVLYNVKSCKFFFRFDIKDAPRFGRLERLRGHGKWASTKRFFSRQLEKGKVRYVHTKGNMK